MQKPFLRAFWAFSVVLVLTACGGGGGDKPFLNAPEPVSASYKLEELDFIDTELRSRHPDLFFNLSETDYQSEFNAFRTASDSMTDIEFRLEMAKFIARIGDQHTYISMPISEMRKFPITLWWEGDRAIVIETIQQHSEYLGQELVSIDGTPLHTMRDTAMQYLAHENEYWKQALSPRFIQLADVLMNEGIIGVPELATFEFLSANSERSLEDINSRIDILDWVTIESQQSQLPYYKLSQDNYSLLLDGDLLYLQYRSAFDQQGYPLTQFIEDVRQIIETDNVSKVIVDIRFNYGGIIDHFVPVIQMLAETNVNTPDNLFVLTGRNSFSSAIGAIYSFRNLTKATFVGGPTGGKPNGFSNVLGFRLPGSRNSMYMSTDYLQVTPEETDSFYPDYTTLFTQQDFIQGRDPAIQFILANWDD